MRSQSHILLVDDEPLILSSLKDLLEFDYTVHATTDCHEAVQLVRKHQIKAVVSDQRMPQMLGHELLKQIKSISPNTIRILLTGYSDLEAVMNSVNAGEIFRYLNKPCKPEMLQSALKLAVQIYDRISDLARQTETNAAARVPLAVPALPPRALHIEVEEKHPSVLFVGYEEKESAELVELLNKKFDVSAAASVDEAFKTLAKKPVSVIVSEIKFEEHDGIDVLSTIKQDYPHIVTVILTEVVDATLAVRSINELQVFRYLTKPQEKSQIEQVVSDAALRNEQYTVQPQTNVLYAAKEINPTAMPSMPEESELRLRLRAAQALLASKNKFE
ncbi:MAG: response regulator [Rhizobacter sp.]|nr:response regulator [Chlorobiales bacterium]